MKNKAEELAKKRKLDFHRLRDLFAESKQWPPYRHAEMGANAPSTVRLRAATAEYLGKGGE